MYNIAHNIGHMVLICNINTHIALYMTYDVTSGVGYTILHTLYSI